MLTVWKDPTGTIDHIVLTYRSYKYPTLSQPSPSLTAALITSRLINDKNILPNIPSRGVPCYFRYLLRLPSHININTNMSNLRQRKPVSDTNNQPQPQHEEDNETLTQQDPPDLRPDLYVVITLLLCLITIIITYYYYRVDLNSKGPFSTFVNDKILGRNPYQRTKLT
jgi:hypothetical protein